MMQRMCEIITARELADNVYTITMEAGALGAKARPGQFVHIKCGEGNLLRRPISICDSRDGYLKIVFFAKGAGTKWLSERKSGFLDLIGPLGTGFSLEGRRILLVGGGVGVPPLLFTAREAIGQVSAILGFGFERNVILKDNFRDVCDQVFITTADGSVGERGFVTDPLARELATGKYDGVLACGPTPMLRAVAKLAAEHNVPCQVSMEERMACGVGACLGCIVPMENGENLRACHDGPVFNATEVKW